MKILNLYSGIGGNRKLWSDKHEGVFVLVMLNSPTCTCIFSGQCRPQCNGMIAKDNEGGDEAYMYMYMYSFSK